MRILVAEPIAAEGVELPPYYDPQYSCEMEMLRFDSSFPNPRYDGWIEEIRAHLHAAPVVRCKQSSHRRDRGLEPINVVCQEHIGLSQ